METYKGTIDKTESKEHHMKVVKLESPITGMITKETKDGWNHENTLKSETA